MLVANQRRRGRYLADGPFLNTVPMSRRPGGLRGLRRVDSPLRAVTDADLSSRLATPSGLTYVAARSCFDRLILGSAISSA